MTKALTKTNSHRAIERGYAGGDLVEPGELVPAGIPVSDEWMESVNKKEADLIRATQEALSPNEADVDLNALKGDALTAHAAGLHINRGDLSDKDLRAAVAAKRADTA